MAGADILNTLSSQLEVVLPEIQEINAADNDQLYGRVKATTKVEKISRYLLRIVLEKYIGGNGAKVSANAGTGGVMPPGTQINMTNLLAGYFTFAIAFRLTDEQTKVIASTQAITDIVARQFAKAVIAQRSYDDVAFAQTGTGILTGSSSATTSTTMTFAGSTDGLGINLLFEGMCVDVWDVTGATKRALGTGAPLQIIAIEYEAKQVTFDQTVTGITTGDIIALQGMASYGPSTLTSFNSSYPGTVGAAAGGIGGDSFRHGYPYMTDPTSSNYFYSKQKSSIPQLLPVRVNANNDALQWEHGLRLIAKIMQKRPQKDAYMALEGIAHQTQRAQVFELGMSISEKLIPGDNFGNSLDKVPSNMKNSDQFMFAGIPHNVSTRQDRTRIDYVNFDKIGRAEASETQPWTIDGSRTKFEVRDPTTGQPVTAFDWFWMSYFENVCFDSGVFGRIDTLGLPSAQWDA